MTIDELDKNSKFGYRREAWGRSSPTIYIAYTDDRWVFARSGGYDRLSSMNHAQTDWELSDIPNAYYNNPKVDLQEIYNEF